jgi:hypothetical protein
MNEKNEPSSTDAIPQEAITSVPMKPFEYSGDFQFLENAVANECESALEPLVGENSVAGSQERENRKTQIPVKLNRRID